MWQWQSLSCSGCSSPWDTFLAHWQVTCHLDLDLDLNRFQERSKPGPGFQASKDGRPFKCGHQVLFIYMGQPWQLLIRGIPSVYMNTQMNRKPRLNTFFAPKSTQKIVLAHKTKQLKRCFAAIFYDWKNSQLKWGLYGKRLLQIIRMFTFLYVSFIMALKTYVKRWFKKTLLLSQVISEYDQLWSLGIGLHCCGAFTDMVIFINHLSTPSSSLSSDWSKYLWKKHTKHIFTAEVLLPTFVFIFFIVIIRLNYMFDIKNLKKTNKNVLHTDHPSSF